MTEQPLEGATLVPLPAAAPAEQELSADEILDFDAPAAVATAVEAEPEASVVESDAPVVESEPGPTVVMSAPPMPIVPENLVAATCPNCGTPGQVDFARRESAGFCSKCDFPLFWSRDRIVLPTNGDTDESGLRRLPGTAGRAALASLLCPACAEPNPATGVTCVRCGSLLHPVAPEPVVVLPEPEPAPAPVVEPSRSWWPYIIAALAAVIALAGVLIVVNN